MESGIGQLKRRFHVLHGEVRLDPSKTCQVIVACGILHNICKDHNILLEDEEAIGDDIDNADLLQPHEELQPGQGLPVAAGVRFRDDFARLHFT